MNVIFYLCEGRSVCIFCLIRSIIEQRRILLSIYLCQFDIHLTGC